MIDTLHDQMKKAIVVVAAEGCVQVAEIYGLRQQYKILSELEEQFPRGSQNKAVKWADQKQREILKKIEELESALNKRQ